MNSDQEERLVVAFEGIYEQLIRAGIRYWPQPKPQREPIVSRIETEEDKAKKNLGIDGKSIKEWLTFEQPVDDEVIGERTRKWLQDNQQSKVGDARSEVAARGKQDGSSTSTYKSKA